MARDTPRVCVRVASVYAQGTGPLSSHVIICVRSHTTVVSVCPLSYLLSPLDVSVWLVSPSCCTFPSSVGWHHKSDNLLAYSASWWQCGFHGCCLSWEWAFECNVEFQAFHSCM
jgi:hypothetical protein